MATKITLTISEEDVGKAKILYVEEDFDTVLEKVYPTQPPTSHLQHRENMLFTSTRTGKRVVIHPQFIGPIEEDVEPD